MPEPVRLCLDQMFRVDVAQALRGQGYDVVRASESGQARADDQRYYKKQLLKREFSLRLMNILVIG